MLGPDATGYPIVNREWPEFKKLLDGTQKTLLVQEENDGETYQLFAVDAILFYKCGNIYLDGKEPKWMTPEERQANTDHRKDYETNFQSGANKQIST